MCQGAVAATFLRVGDVHLLTPRPSCDSTPSPPLTIFRGAVKHIHHPGSLRLLYMSPAIAMPAARPQSRSPPPPHTHKPPLHHPPLLHPQCLCARPSCRVCLGGFGASGTLLIWFPWPAGCPRTTLPTYLHTLPSHLPYTPHAHCVLSSPSTLPSQTTWNVLWSDQRRREHHLPLPVQPPPPAPPQARRSRSRRPHGPLPPRPWPWPPLAADPPNPAPPRPPSPCLQLPPPLLLPLRRAPLPPRASLSCGPVWVALSWGFVPTPPPPPSLLQGRSQSRFRLI
jgi:hypothetical protein